MPMALGLSRPASRRSAIAAAMVGLGSAVGMRSVRTSSGPVPTPQTNFVPPASMAPNNVIPEEAQAVEGDGIRRLFDIAPDCRGGADIADVEAEAFDRQPAVVGDVFQRLENAWPVGVAAAGSTAVVLAGVNVPEMAGHSVDPRCDVFLFDVGVERVKKNTDVRVIDFVAEPHGVRGGIEEIRL